MTECDLDLGQSKLGPALRTSSRYNKFSAKLLQYFFPSVKEIHSRYLHNMTKCDIDLGHVVTSSFHGRGPQVRPRPQRYFSHTRVAPPTLRKPAGKFRHMKLSDPERI